MIPKVPPMIRGLPKESAIAAPLRAVIDKEVEILESDMAYRNLAQGKREKVSADGLIKVVTRKIFGQVYVDVLYAAGAGEKYKFEKKGAYNIQLLY